MPGFSAKAPGGCVASRGMAARRGNHERGPGHFWRAARGKCSRERRSQPDHGRARYRRSVSTSSPSAPTDDALAALLLSAQHAEVRAPAAGDQAARTLLTVSGHDLTALRHAMRLSPGPGGHCMCAGDLELAVLGPDGDWTKISLHHGYTMRWKGPWSWPDVAFADPEGFMAWLADHGVTLYLDMEVEAQARQREEQAQRTRWLAATPACLRERLDVLEVGALGGPAPGSPRVLEAITELRATSDPSTVVIALLRWFGSGVGRWSGYPTYENVPEALLVTLGTAQVLAGITGRELDTAALSGLARYFGSWEYRKERRAELRSVPQELRDQLVAHVRANLDEGDVQRLESAVKAASRTQGRPRG